MKFDTENYKLPPFIGLVGEAGYGKSTSAWLLGELGYVTVPLALPLKNMLKTGFGLTDADLSQAHKNKACPKLNGHTPRYAAQTLGTEWGRAHLGESIWLSAWEVLVDKMGAHLVVVDDVRFYNEIQFIHFLGGVIFQVHRPDHPTIGSDHESEHNWKEHLDLVDWTVINDGDEDALRAKLERALYGVAEKIPAEVAD